MHLEEKKTQYELQNKSKDKNRFPLIINASENWAAQHLKVLKEKKCFYNRLNSFISITFFNTHAHP